MTFRADAFKVAMEGPSLSPREHVATFFELLQRFHADKHTGPVTIHFAQGSPNVIELPCEPVRIVLDKGAR